MDPRSSVVFLCGDDTDGAISHARNLLGIKVHEIAGGTAGLFGLGNEGVYDAISGKVLSNVDLACAAVGKASTIGVSSTIIRTHSPLKPTGADADVGSLYSWGIGDMGELGLGPAHTQVGEPQKVRYEKSVAFASISCGDNHSAAVDARGNLYAWGQNFSKQLGLYTKKLEAMQELRPNATTEDLLFSPRLVPLSLQRPVSKAACGGAFTIVLTKSGEIWSWGAGECGQLGTGRCTFRELPSKVELTPLPIDTAPKKKKAGKKDEPPPARKEELGQDIACGSAHALVLTRKGAVYGWGFNKNGQLGVRDTNTRFSAAEVPVTSTANSAEPTAVTVPLTRIFAYLNDSAGIDASGRLWTWGSAAHHRLMREVDTGSVNAQRSLSISDLSKTMGLQALGNTMRTKSAPGSSRKALEGVPITYSAEPSIVTHFLGQRVLSFAYSARGSAVLVRSTLESVSPKCGPLKGFSKLKISGYGFWDCDKIIVRFALQGGDLPSRSCVGRLSAAREIECRPPKLTEAGTYDVTVSFDGGKTFLSEVLNVRAYKELSANSIVPSMVDLRQTTTAKVTVTARSMQVYEEGTVDDSGKRLWPTESDLENNLYVNLLVSCSAPGALEPVYTEVRYPGRLLPLGNLNYDSVVNPDGSLSLQNSVADNGSVDEEASFAEGSSVAGGDSFILNHAPDRGIECSVDFSSLGPPGSLIMLRGAVSLNAQDFGTASPENAPIICHSFCALGSAPACCPAEERYSSENIPCSREISILGSSFIPTSKLPSGMSIEAVVRVETGINPKTKKASYVEKFVPISCDAADILYIAMPTIGELFAPGAQVPPKTPRTPSGLGETEPFSSRPNTEKSSSAAAASVPPEECMAQVFFRLVVPPEDVPDKKGSKTPSSSPQKSSTASKKEAPMLSPDPVNVYLYKSQPISLRPSLVRRAGGAELVIVSAAPSKGFNFKSSDVRVVLYRTDLGLEMAIPPESTFMLGLNEEVPVPEPIVAPAENAEEEDDEGIEVVAAAGDAAVDNGLAAGVSMLSLDTSMHSASFHAASSLALPSIAEGLVADSVVGAALVGTPKPTASTFSGLGQPHKIVVKCPALFLPALLSQFGVAATAGVGVEGEAPTNNTHSEERGDESKLAGADEQTNTGVTQDQHVEEEAAIPLDFLKVRVLLDGRSPADDSESAFVSLFYAVEISGDPVQAAGGAAALGSLCTVSIDHGLVRSESCVVRLRGGNTSAKPLTCVGRIHTEASATPETVERMYAQQAAAAEAERLAAERGPDVENTDEDNTTAAADASGGAAPADPVPVPVPAPEPEPEPKGYADIGGSHGTVTFDLPDCASLEPVMDGNRKMLYVDVSLDGGVTWDETAQPLLNIK